MQYIFNTYYTVLRTVNHFSKIKKAFSVKLKMISVDHHFRLYQTPKNKKLYIYIYIYIYFRKYFTPKQIEPRFILISITWIHYYKQYSLEKRYSLHSYRQTWRVSSSFSFLFFFFLSDWDKKPLNACYVSGCLRVINMCECIIYFWGVILALTVHNRCTTPRHNGVGPSV
jgi:hypothetical protein